MTRRRKAWLALALGALAVTAVVLMGIRDSRDPVPRFSLPLLIIVGLAAITSIAGGLSLLRAERQVAGGGPDEPVSYRHAYRVFAVMAGLVLGALVARGLAVPADYGVVGPFRAGARGDAAGARTPRFQGAAACVKCHTESAARAKDVHHTVECEDCHGPADRHIAAPREQHLASDKTNGGCLVCHRHLTARPSSFPQVSLPAHFRLVGAKDEGVACISCHNPHEPVFLTTPVSEARLHPLVHRCRDCHLGRTDETLQRPPNHPAIFQCSYCHGSVAKDFASRTHAKLACTTCHLFLKDSDFAGRIVRNTDPRFCLLCHREGDFRREDSAPTIDWNAHRKTYDETLDEKAPCVTCHADTIHGDLVRSNP